MEADAGPDDVHDGVHGADFVEMNFLEGDIVDAGFGFAELDENRRGAVTNLGRKLRFLKNFENRAERAMLRLVFGLDLDVGGSHAVFPHFFGDEVPTGNLEAAEFGAEMFDVTAGVHQGAERHVAANA